MLLDMWRDAHRSQGAILWYKLVVNVHFGAARSTNMKGGYANGTQIQNKIKGGHASTRNRACVLEAAEHR